MISCFTGSLKKGLCTGQVFDAVVHFVMQCQNVEAQALAPVIEAVPLEIALDRQVLGIQTVARHRVFQPVVARIAAYHELFPNIGIERQVKNGPVHVEHQRFAVLHGRFRIECHCSILRAPVRVRMFI